MEVSNTKRLEMIASCAETIMRYVEAVTAGNTTHTIGNVHLQAQIIRDNAKRLLEKE